MPRMRDEIASLLTAAEQSGDFLSAPALDVFARQIVPRGMERPARRSHRLLHGRATAGRGRDGRGVARARRAARARRGDQAAASASVERRRTRARVCSTRRAPPARLNHTNVLTVYDVGDHGGAPYLVTECLEGESLRARLGAGALSGGRGARRRAPGGARAWRGARSRHRASRPEAGEHLPRARRPREDPRFRPRDTPATSGTAGHRRRNVPPRPRDRSSPAPRATWRRSRCAARPSIGARTSSRSAPCSTKCSPARRPFKGHSALETLDAVLDAASLRDLVGRESGRVAGAGAHRAPVPREIAGRPVRDGRRSRGRARLDHPGAEPAAATRACARSSAGRP